MLSSHFCYPRIYQNRTEKPEKDKTMERLETKMRLPNKSRTSTNHLSGSPLTEVPRILLRYRPAHLRTTPSPLLHPPNRQSWRLGQQAGARPHGRTLRNEDRKRPTQAGS